MKKQALHSELITNRYDKLADFDDNTQFKDHIIADTQLVG